VVGRCYLLILPLRRSINRWRNPLSQSQERGNLLVILLAQIAISASGLWVH